MHCPRVGMGGGRDAEPDRGYRASLVFEPGEERRWPEATAQSQGAEHCRRWVSRVLVSGRDRNRWLRSAGRLPRSGPIGQAAGMSTPGERAVPPGANAQARSKDYVGSGDAARLLGVSRGTITRWAREDRLPHARTLGGQARLALADLEALAGIPLSAKDLR